MSEIGVFVGFGIGFLVGDCYGSLSASKSCIDKIHKTCERLIQKERIKFEENEIEEPEFCGAVCSLRKIETALDKLSRFRKTHIL